MCESSCCNGKIWGNKDLALIILRVIPGIIFLLAGIYKLMNMGMVVGGFTPIFGGYATVMSYLVAIVEILGGVSLLLGIFLRYSTPALAVIMIVATAMVHWPQGNSLLTSFMSSQFTLSLLTTLVAIGILGAGKYSLAKWDKSGCCGGCSDNCCKTSSPQV